MKDSEKEIYHGLKNLNAFLQELHCVLIFYERICGENIRMR